MALGANELRGLIASDPDLAEIMNSSLGARQVYFDALRAMGRIPAVVITTANSTEETIYISDSKQIPLTARSNNVESWRPSPARE